MVFSERPGYRIDSRTIKRGSRPSIVIVSFVESSNHCIIGIIFIGSYLALIVVWFWCLSCSSWQDQVHRRLTSYATSVHLYLFLFGSYRGVVLVLVVLVMTSPSSPKTNVVCFLYCVFGFGDFDGSSLWKVHSSIY